MSTVTFIYPHFNRVDLFRPNLDSLLSQTDRDFEIVTVDNSEDPEPWIRLVNEYRRKGLDIHAVTLDPSKCKYFVQAYKGLINPGASQNLGAKLATGNIIVLSSPEVINAKTNVENIKKFFSNNNNANTFLHGWVDERRLETIPREFLKDLTTHRIFEICNPIDKKYVTRCRPEFPRDNAYYLGAMLKERFLALGGINEKYMGGLAAEDDEFGKRVKLFGMKIKISEDVAGIHLYHPKTWTSFAHKNWNLIKSFNPSTDVVANKSHDWGSLSYIKRRV